MQSSKECASCHAVNDALLRFCTSCGAALGLSCGKCGAIGQFGDRFCGTCGTASTGGPGDGKRSKTLKPFEAAVAVNQYSAEDIEELLELRVSMNTEQNAVVSMGQSDIDSLFVQP